VVAILALVTGLVAINLPDDPDPTEDDARTLAVTLNRAAQASLTDGATRSLALSREGWSLRRFQDGEWQAVAADQFEARRVELFVEAAKVELSDDPLPYIIFEPTGQATPFELTLRDRDGNWSLEGTETGRVSVEAGRRGR